MSFRISRVFLGCMALGIILLALGINYFVSLGFWSFAIAVSVCAYMGAMVHRIRVERAIRRGDITEQVAFGMSDEQKEPYTPHLLPGEHIEGGTRRSKNRLVWSALCFMLGLALLVSAPIVGDIKPAAWSIFSHLPSSVSLHVLQNDAKETKAENRARKRQEAAQERKAKRQAAKRARNAHSYPTWLPLVLVGFLFDLLGLWVLLSWRASRLLVTNMNLVDAWLPPPWLPLMSDRFDRMPLAKLDEADTESTLASRFLGIKAWGRIRLRLYYSDPLVNNQDRVLDSVPYYVLFANFILAAARKAGGAGAPAQVESL